MMTKMRFFLLFGLLMLGSGVANAGIIRHIIAPVMKTAPRVVSKVVVTTFKVTKAIVY